MERAKLDIAAVKSRRNLSDVVARHVKLKKAGHEFVGLCPFHDENTASFRVNDAKGVFHCFGCSAAGDVIDFVKAAEGMTFMEAVKAASQKRSSNEKRLAPPTPKRCAGCDWRSSSCGDVIALSQISFSM